MSPHAPPLRGTLLLRAGFLGRRPMLAWAALAALLLAGCTTPLPPKPPGQQAWSGRLSLVVNSEPPQSFYAGFDLRGTPQAGELQLNSPLGNALATVHWSPEGAELRQAEQVTRRKSLTELTTELGGAPLPVAAMFAWLQGFESETPGWQADLTRQPEGRVDARRTQPLPAAELRIVFAP